jgi:tetratricopeptide (TPR) repeat protein
VHLNQSLRCIIVAVVAVAAPFSLHAAQESGISQAAMDAGDAYLRALQAASAAYVQRDFATALDKLDVADQIHPDIPDTWNMRGAIYAEQHAFEKAGDAFDKAAQLNPGDFWPPYNLAELLLMQKKYGPAADAFEKLEIYGGHQELVQFKIVFANLLQGKPDAAKPVLDAMKFPSDTPAYYYAQAAWSYYNKDQKSVSYWSNEGLKIFGLGPCLSFYDSLAQVGWLPMRNRDGSVPEPAELSKLPAATSGLLGLPVTGGS